jgi:RNA polymerase sigma-70 factor (ECF subfamily)
MSDAAERLYERLLVVRCQAQAEDALAELIARYSPRIRFFLRKMSGDDLADDLLQDVWLVVIARMSKLRDPGAFSAWIYRIARDKAYAQLSRKRLPAVAIDEHLSEEIVEADDEWCAEDVTAVRAALDRLAPEHREVILLRFVEDMDYQQIAAVVGCRVGTVRSRIHYAKRALRAAMEKSQTKGIRS